MSLLNKVKKESNKPGIGPEAAKEIKEVTKLINRAAKNRQHNIRFSPFDYEFRSEIMEHFEKEGFSVFIHTSKLGPNHCYIHISWS